MQKWLCPVLLVAAILLIGPFPQSSNSFLLDHFNGTRDVLARIRNGVTHLHQLHETFHGLLRELGFDPLGKVHDKLLPEAVKLLGMDRSQIGRCYDSSVGGRPLDIFAESLHSILLGYFVSLEKNRFDHEIQFFLHLQRSHFYLIEGRDGQSTLDRVRNLLDNVRKIGRYVIDCTLKLDTTKPTVRLGLTRASSFVSILY